MQPKLTAYEGALRQEAIARVAAGESVRAVARALSIGRTTVRRWCASQAEASGHTTGHCDRGCDHGVTDDVMTE